MCKHPIQPIYKTETGTHRFKENAIIRFLIDNGSYDLNRLAVMDFSNEDWTQLAQLIGYSFSGWGTLSYVSDEDYYRAEPLNDALLEYVPNYVI